MTATASRLLDRFQQGEVYYVPLLAGANAWDPKTAGTPVKIKATVSGVSQKYVNELVSASDLHAILPVFGVVPQIGAALKIDGVEKQIIAVKPSPAAGTVVCWHVFVKG